MLSLARALGEAAPLILVGAVTGLLPGERGAARPGQLQERFTALPIVITEWATQPPATGSSEITAAAIVVLLVIVLVVNTAAILLRNRYEKKRYLTTMAAEVDLTPAVELTESTGRGRR